MYLCADKTEKLSGGSSTKTAAVATAVVSKPEAKNTTLFVVRLTRKLYRLRHAVHHLDFCALGLRVRQRLRSPWDAKHVPVGRDPNALLGKGDRLVHLGDVGHTHRAPRPHNYL